MLVDVAVVRDAPDRVHQQRFAERRTAPSLVLQVERCRHVHERQRHELGEPTGLALKSPGAHHVACPVHGLFDRAEHDGDVRLQADLVRGAMGEQPLVGVDLVGAQHGTDLVVEDLGGRARQCAKPGIHQSTQVVGQRLAEAPRALGHLERGEAVDVDLGATSCTARATSM